MAKKKAEALHQERERFVRGAVANNIPPAAANTIFDDWEAFARYGFPKGHAADYAVICVQTAYLKAHFPTEYMAALMSVFKADTDKVALYIVDCRRMGIEVLPPDVNACGLDFDIEDRPEAKPAIRFGLAAIKNVGVGPVQVILDARQAGGRFGDVEDFARRVDLRLVGKRALESLAKVGALDSLCPRCNLLDALDRLISPSTAHFRAAEIGLMSLFGGATGVSERLEMPASAEGVPVRQQLTWEKELLGVYISDHPLAPYLETLTQVVTHFSAELGDADHGQAVTVAGEVSHLRPYQTRTGKAMHFVTLEDLQGSIELVVFAKVWAEVSRWLVPGSIVLVRGKVDSERGSTSVPFLQIVLSGYIPYYGEARNFSSDVRSDLLQHAEYGAYPSFFVTYEDPAQILNTSSNWIYVSSYQQMKTEIEESYAWLDALLAPVKGASIIAHDEIAAGVTATTYSNGKQILVNYRDHPFYIDGLTIDARDAVLREVTP